MDENKHSIISHAASLEAMGEFWDSHDFTAYDTAAPDVAFTIARPVQVEIGLLRALEQHAHKRGVSLETLVNLWLQQKRIGEARAAA